MYWPFLICIQKILDLGQQVFIVRGTFINRKKGLPYQNTLHPNMVYAPSTLLRVIWSSNPVLLAERRNPVQLPGRLSLMLAQAAKKGPLSSTSIETV